MDRKHVRTISGPAESTDTDRKLRGSRRCQWQSHHKSWVGTQQENIWWMHQHECSTCDPFPVTHQPNLQDLLQIDTIKLPKCTFPKCIQLLHAKIQEKQWSGPRTQQAPHAFRVDTNRWFRKTCHPYQYWCDVRPICRPSHPRSIDGRHIHHGHHEMWPFQHIIRKMACTSRQKQNMGQSNSFLEQGGEPQTYLRIHIRTVWFRRQSDCYLHHRCRCIIWAVGKLFFFGFWKESNKHLRIDHNQHTIATTDTTGTNDVPRYDKSRTSSNIADAFSTTTTNADPEKKLEK